jgi:pseudouridine-5'-phosphate glycosidase
MTELFQPRLSEEVADAITSGHAVVALESTIISHGMPYPENLEVARGVEAVVRQNGAVPATVAVIDGVVHAGLGAGLLERLGNDPSVVKASSRDLATVLVKKRSAGTTVSATMRIAALSGIKLFATGGVGGVHRGAEQSFDISADLTELSRTPVTVVCAGVKSILDIPKTLETLETLRVPVIGYGTDEFPAFFTRESGERADQRLDTPDEVATAIRLHDRLGAGTGVMLANPIPADASLDRGEIDRIIAEAVVEAEKKGITRKALTPFLLARINELSKGRSLKANIALVRNNAAVAARVAVAYSEPG